MGILGALVGVALASAAGWLLGSWLVFAVSVLPLVVVGALLGMGRDMVGYQRLIIAKPAVVDDDVARLVSREKWREAHQRLQHAVGLLEQATRTPRPDRDAIEALAARWRSQAQTCMDRHLGFERGPLRAARARHRDSR
jgi:hypothetical protein